MIREPRQPVVENLWGEIEQTLESFGYELVDMKLGGRGKGRTLTILIDKPQGVSVGDCQYMASRLSVLLDTIDPMEGRYTLLVSSPGVNRPITRDSDFERFAGEQAAIRFRNAEGKPGTREGQLLGVSGDQIRLETADGELLIPLADVERAHLTYDWDSDPAFAEEQQDPPSMEQEKPR